MSIDINATPEDVWRALTDAGELMRWFPLQARVTPGKGGSVFWGWDQHWAWESEIDAWEPGARLRLVENRPAFDVNGKPLAGPRSSLAMEFTLETHAGQTTTPPRPLRIRRRRKLGRRARRRSAPAGSSSCAGCVTTSSATRDVTGTMPQRITSPP